MTRATNSRTEKVPNVTRNNLNLSHRDKAACEKLVGGVAQWLERRSLNGELSLIYA